MLHLPSQARWHSTRQVALAATLPTVMRLWLTAGVLQVQRDQGAVGVLRQQVPVHRPAQPVQEVRARRAGAPRALPAGEGRPGEGLPVRTHGSHHVLLWPCSTVMSIYGELSTCQARTSHLCTFLTPSSMVWRSCTRMKRGRSFDTRTDGITARSRCCLPRAVSSRTTQHAGAARTQEVPPGEAGRAVLPEQAGVGRAVDVLQGVHPGTGR